MANTSWLLIDLFISTTYRVILCIEIICLIRNWGAEDPSVPTPTSHFCSMNRLGVLLLPPGWDTSPLQVTSQNFVRLSPK